MWQHKNPCADVAFRHNFAVEGVKLDRMGIHASLGGRVLRFDMIYPALGCDVRSDLASELGAATTEIVGLKVDEHQRTTVEGLYAAGDVVSDLHQISVAIGHAAIAATHIHKCLPDNLKRQDGELTVPLAQR